MSLTADYLARLIEVQDRFTPATRHLIAETFTKLIPIREAERALTTELVAVVRTPAQWYRVMVSCTVPWSFHPTQYRVAAYNATDAERRAREQYGATWTKHCHLLVEEEDV